MEKLCAAAARRAAGLCLSTAKCDKLAVVGQQENDSGLLYSWLKLVANPLLWWEKVPEKAIPTKEHSFFQSIREAFARNFLCNLVLAEEQLFRAKSSNDGENQWIPRAPSVQDSYVKCVASHRTRYRAGNTGSSGNIGVMRKLREEGWFEEALEIVDKMDKQGMEITSNVLLCLLQEAITRKNLEKGRELHRLTKNHNLESDIFLGTFFIRLYATCGCLPEAIEAFNKATDRSVFTWSAMIAAHTKLGKGEDGLKVYKQMLLESPLKPEENVLVAALQACASIPSIDEGKAIHKHIAENTQTLGSNANIGSALIDMYTKCGNLEEARKVFDRLPKRDLVVWNAMIISYSYFKRVPEAIRLVQLLQQERLKPNEATYLSVLEACGVVKELNQCKAIHTLIIQNNYECNSLVANALMDMYTKCGNLEEVCNVFNRLRLRDGTNWHALITGHVQLGDCPKALQLAAAMQREATCLKEAFVPLLKASIDMSDFVEARRLHARVLGSLNPDPLIGCALIDMFCRSGKIEEAFRAFDKWPSKTVDLWNSMITGYAEHGLGQKSLSLCKQMLKDNMKPAAETFVCMLKACIDISDLEQGKEIHNLIKDTGNETNSLVEKALNDMYEVCRNTEEAQGLSAVKV